MRLAILILHRLGDPLGWRAAVRDVEYLLPEHSPDHDYIVHPAEIPLPEFVKSINFHAIILGPTFLCARYAPHTFAQVKADYAFVAASDAFKIALPQDDYDSSALLDRWMIDWNVDTLYAAVSQHWPVLYPEYSKTGRIRQGYTGYIADSWLRRFRDPKPHSERTIDVSYRANKLPPNFGRVGRIKGEIGDRFAAHPATAGLRLDISTSPGAVIPGDGWHDFLEESRSCLVTNSGSSVLDPSGAIRACVERELIEHPDATFEQVESRCFKGEDGRYTFMAISPRNLEAALANTVQIATVGPYSGILAQHEHYLPLEPDCSNAADVVRQMRDGQLLDRIAARARHAVLAVPALRATHHAEGLITQIVDGVSTKRIQATPTADRQRMIARYRDEMTSVTNRFWGRRRRRERLRRLAVSMGARKVKRWLMTPN